MNKPSEIGRTKDKDIGASMEAMKRAAAMARKTAMQTNTAIVVIQGTKIVRVTAENLRMKVGA